MWLSRKKQIWHFSNYLEKYGSFENLCTKHTNLVLKKKGIVIYIGTRNWINLFVAKAFVGEQIVVDKEIIDLENISAEEGREIDKLFKLLLLVKNYHQFIISK